MFRSSSDWTHTGTYTHGGISFGMTGHLKAGSLILVLGTEYIGIWDVPCGPCPLHILQGRLFRPLSHRRPFLSMAHFLRDGRECSIYLCCNNRGYLSLGPTSRGDGIEGTKVEPAADLTSSQMEVRATATD